MDNNYMKQLLILSTFNTYKNYLYLLKYFNLINQNEINNKITSSSLAQIIFNKY